MSFNFGNLANAKPVSSTNYLKAYTIYENVGIKNAEVKSGTSANGNNWKSLNITFGNDEGIYNHSIFYPNETNPKDVNRPEFDQPNGGKRYAPSAIEELQNQIASIGFEFFPDDFTKLQAVAGKISTVEQLMDYFKKFIDKNLDKVHTNMKLTGRTSNGRVYATLPKFTGIACADTETKAKNNNVAVGEWYTWRVSPFGPKAAFTDYEQRMANEYHSAKPTKMDSSISSVEIVNPIDAVPSNLDDANIDDLIASL